MLFYVTFIDFGEFYGPGKDRKIKGQIEALKAGLGEVYYTYYSYPMLYLMDDETVIEKQPAVTRRDQILVLCSWLEKYRVTKTYVRYPLASKWFVDLLKYQKEHNIKTILEIPTYPYDGELEDDRSRTEDMCYRKDIHKYVDRISTSSADDMIWDVPCIGVINGISASDVIIRTKIKENKKIMLIAVGTMKFWQGYERIIEGMYLYYQKNGEYDIRLKVIGSGPEEQNYMDLVEKYKLNSKVEFVGQIEIGEIDRLNGQYALADIAVSSLGGYKKELNEWAPIKGAEYCAKGIPFICGYRDPRFPAGWKYMMRVPNDSSPIDMESVIDFYENVTSSEDYKEEMRDYAMNYLTWTHIMDPVIDYFISDECDGQEVS